MLVQTVYVNVRLPYTSPAAQRRFLDNRPCACRTDSARMCICTAGERWARTFDFGFSTRSRKLGRTKCAPRVQLQCGPAAPQQQVCITTSGIIELHGDRARCRPQRAAVCCACPKHWRKQYSYAAANSQDLRMVCQGAEPGRPAASRSAAECCRCRKCRFCMHASQTFAGNLVSQRCTCHASPRCMQGEQQQASLRLPVITDRCSPTPTA